MISRRVRRIVFATKIFDKDKNTVNLIIKIDPIFIFNHNMAVL